MIYRDHALELGNSIPEKPLIFLKPPSSYVCQGKAIQVSWGGRGGGGSRFCSVEADSSKYQIIQQKQFKLSPVSRSVF